MTNRHGARGSMSLPAPTALVSGGDDSTPLRCASDKLKEHQLGDNNLELHERSPLGSV